MTVEMLQTLSLAAYIIAGVLFLVAVALFFLLDILKVYGDISGRTAKKAIEAIRRQNESTGNKAYKPSAVNAKRGKLTDKITPSGRLKERTAGLPINVGTEKIATSRLTSQTNETIVLNEQTNETTVLKDDFPAETGETTLLVDGEPQVIRDSENGKFRVDIELSFTGSSEIIE